MPVYLIIEQLRVCFASPEYQAIAHLREDSTTSRSIIVGGHAPKS